MIGMKLSVAVAAVGLCAFAGAAEVAPLPAPGHVAVLESAVVKKQAIVNFNSCAKPVWPAHSLRQAQQGTVTLAFLVGADGAVRDSKIVKSSGHPLLDIAAMEGIAKCRFKAATADGQAVETWSRMQYVWTLSDRAATRPEAVADLQRRAEEGDAKAQFELAMLHLNGTGVPKNRAAGTDWMRRAAEQGDAEAQGRLAMLLVTPGAGSAPEEAASWMMKAAEQGNANAQAMYASMLLRGAGVPADARAAAEWLGKAAETDHAAAQGMLGALMLKEQPERAEEALAWLRKAAAGNDAMAQTVLADCYDQGKFVEQDKAQANALYSKAAQAGSRPAMFKLADRYDRGDGVVADHERAKQLRIAARSKPQPFN